MGAGESDTARDNRVCSRCSQRERYREENRATTQSWLKEWTPQSVAAARAMQPIWSQPGEKVIRFEDSLEHSRRRFDGVLDHLDLNAKELDT